MKPCHTITELCCQCVWTVHFGLTILTLNLVSNYFDLVLWESYIHHKPINPENDFCAPKKEKVIHGYQQ